MYIQKIRERVENEEKEVKPTFREDLKELARCYKILKKRNEEARKSIRKIKKVYEQYLPKMRHRMCWLEASVNEMERKYAKESSYFGWVDRAGYNRCRSDICSGQRKMMSVHQNYEDCVKETIENQTFLIWGYSPKYTFELFMQKFERLLTHGETSPTEWLKCYEIIVECMKNEWYVKRELIIPEKIQEMMRKLKTDEENEHSSFFCDLADCKLCEARKHIEEESDWSDDSLPSQINTDEE